MKRIIGLLLALLAGAAHAQSQEYNFPGNMNVAGPNLTLGTAAANGVLKAPAASNAAGNGLTFTATNGNGTSQNGGGFTFNLGQPTSGGNYGLFTANLDPNTILQIGDFDPSGGYGGVGFIVTSNANTTGCSTLFQFVTSTTGGDGPIMGVTCTNSTGLLTLGNSAVSPTGAVEYFGCVTNPDCYLTSGAGGTSAVASWHGGTLVGTWYTEEDFGSATASFTGIVGLAGGTSGKVSIKPQSVAGTYNFNLPTTAGSAGQLLTSQGGGSSAMTWTDLGSPPAIGGTTPNRITGTFFGSTATSNYATSAYLATYSPFYWQGSGTTTGTCTLAVCGMNMLIGTDQMVTSQNSAVLGIINTAGSSNNSGQTEALYVQQKVAGPTAGGNGTYLGIQLSASANATENGISGTPSGRLWGFDAICSLTTAALYFVSCKGGEIDFGVDANSSAQKLAGLSLVLQFNGTAATIENYGVSLNAASATNAGVQGAYIVGDYDGYNPMQSTGEAFCFWAHAATSCGTGSFGSLGTVLDASNVTIGSYFLKSTGFTVDGSGNANAISVGATTPGTGAFTTLSASSTVSGTGFSTYLASPPAIGGTAAAAGSFTALSASSSAALTSAPLTISGNISTASALTGGVGLIGTATPNYTDTSGTGGTIANAYMFAFPAVNLETTTTTTYTNVGNVFIPAPTCSVGGGGTPTCTSLFSLITGASINVRGNVTAGSTNQFLWASRGILTSTGAGNMQLGAANAAAPSSQTLTTQGSRGGTDSNIAGGNLTISSGQGTGNATGSTLALQTPHAGSTGTTAQTLNTQISMGDNTVSMPNLASSSAATTGTVCWTTGGNLTVDTTLACLSSLGEWKQNIGPLYSGLAEVMKLKPVSYELKPEHDPQHLGRQVGFLAEDVEKVDKRLVGYGGDGKLRGVRYMQMAALVVKGEQDLQAEIRTLRAQNAALEARLKRLEARR